MDGLPTKKEFWTIIFVLMLGFGLLAGCDGPHEPLKFKVGQMIQTKVGEQIGQIIDTWPNAHKYTVRFQREGSEHGTTFVTNIMNEFELERCSAYNGPRC